MAFTMVLTYRGENDNAVCFAHEMMDSGIVEAIRKLDGCLMYTYYRSFDDPTMIILMDQWVDQAALDRYHQSYLMEKVAALREKYDLHVKAKRYIEDDLTMGHHDDRYLRP